MTCAKRHVFCSIHSRFGVIANGSNSCEKPQAVCPREPGEGYEKCKSICQQGGHAEIAALEDAKVRGIDLRGGTAYLKGHYWICEPCGRALRDAGVVAIHVTLAP